MINLYHLSADYFDVDFYTDSHFNQQYIHFFLQKYLKLFSQTEAEEETVNKKRSKKCEKKYKLRQKVAKVEPAIEEQFQAGRILGLYFLSIENLPLI